MPIYRSRLTCFSFRVTSAPSLTPVSQVKAIIARLRRSITVEHGLRCKTLSICSVVGTGRGFGALAMRSSFSESRKYSASEYLTRLR